MENLSKSQKTILIVIATVMLLVIGYYFMQKTEQYDNFETIQMVQNNGENSSNTSSKQDETKTIVIHIIGAILDEGIVTIEPGSRIVDVINEAGGTSSYADLSRVNLAYMVSDGQKIYIPSIYDEDEKEIISSNSGNDIVVDGNIFQPNGTVNINKATQTELETLTGIRTIYSF